MTHSCITPISISALLASVAWIVFISLVIDPQRMESAERYEECIMETYDMHPSSYYQMSGEYPTCI
jgi:hypothetical protein